MAGGVAPLSRARDPCGLSILFQVAHCARFARYIPLKGTNGAASSQPMGNSASAKHSVRIAGHATSVSLEPEFWQALCDIAAQRGQPVNVLLAEIDAARSGNLSSAIRIFVLAWYRREFVERPP
jgi:predicted DNA-binding ribbon-helix-helix protein